MAENKNSIEKMIYSKDIAKEMFQKIEDDGIQIPFFQVKNISDYDFNHQMHTIASRYKVEEELLSAITSGDEKKAILTLEKYRDLMQTPEQLYRPTSSDFIRDFKNSLLVMNTLFRKAVEKSLVHPIYIHESSSFFGEAIEACQSEQDFISVIRKMIHVYCQLVHQYSLAHYSSAVRHTILYIDMNLASPLSTATLAEREYLSPNYLSTKFHQEVGVSISEYILNQRIRLACELLTSTDYSIQDIANTIGIGDASYFSKQFKQKMGTSPIKYKKSGH